jgi:hypothetical protein
MLSIIIVSSCASNFEEEHLPTITETDTFSVSTESANILVTTTPEFPVSATLDMSQKYCDASPDSFLENTAGRIIVQSNAAWYFYDPSNGEIFTIPGYEKTFIPFMISSPDHTKAAFYNFEDESTVIVFADGRAKKIATKDNVNGELFEWQNNENLIFVNQAHSDGSIIVLNIETLTLKEVRTEIKDVYFDAVRWYASGVPTVLFDTTLNKLIYLKRDTSSSNSSFKFIMMDQNTHKILWESNSSDTGTSPVWSLDGKYAAIFINDEKLNTQQIIIVDKHGNEINKIDTEFVTVMVWSPNGQKLGYLFFDGQENLGVYDVQSGQTQKYALSYETGFVTWSPDSEQIAVSNLIIDTSMKCVNTINTDNQSELEILAWIVDP